MSPQCLGDPSHVPFCPVSYVFVFAVFNVIVYAVFIVFVVDNYQWVCFCFFNVIVIVFNVLVF